MFVHMLWGGRAAEEGGPLEIYTTVEIAVESIRLTHGENATYDVRYSEAGDLYMEAITGDGCFRYTTSMWLVNDVADELE